MDARAFGDAMMVIGLVAAFCAPAMLGAIASIILFLFGVATAVALIPLGVGLLAGVALAWRLKQER